MLVFYLLLVLFVSLNTPHDAAGDEHAPPEAASSSASLEEASDHPPVENVPPSVKSNRHKLPYAPLLVSKLGLEGNCPVTLVEKQTWREGDPQWQAQHGSQTFLFISAEERDRFKAAPERYAPIASGNDPVIAKESGQLVPGQRRFGVYYRDRICLFSSEESLQKFNEAPELYIESALAADPAPRVANPESEDSANFSSAAKGEPNNQPPIEQVQPPVESGSQQLPHAPGLLSTFALDGYCPVTLVEKQAWRMGDPRWQAQHGSQTFLFVSAKEREQFQAAPERYAPIASGNDPVIAKESRQLVPGQRRFGVFYRDRICLFSSYESLQKFSRAPELYVESALAAVPAPRVETAESDDDFNLEQLLAKVPVLSPDNPELKSVQFSTQLPTSLHVALPVKVTWTASSGMSVVYLDPQNSIPFAWLAENKLMFYDATLALITLYDDVSPALVLKAGPNKFNVHFGWAEDKPLELLVDLPSFLRSTGQKPQVTKVDATTYKLIYLSESGESRIVAYFELAQQFPLKRLEFRTGEDDLLVLCISDIVINDAQAQRPLKFPTTDLLPPELKVEQVATDSSADESIKKQAIVHLIRALALRLAMHDPELRGVASDIDWEQVKQTDQIAGPKLRALLESP